jgi:uncharacterized protein
MMALRPGYRYTTGAPGWVRVATADAAAVDAGLRAYMLRVHNWMASGLVLTGTVAYLIADIPEPQALFCRRAMASRGAAVQPTVLAYIAMFAPLAFVPVLSFGIDRLSKTAAQALFSSIAPALSRQLAETGHRQCGPVSLGG